MAIVQFGATVTDITGSIGGWTFQRNAAGNIVRLKGSKTRASTTKQTTAHQVHIKFLQLWQQLSAADQLLWNTFASTFTKENKFGETKTLTGQNWFESLNFYRDLLGLAIFSSPPAHALPTPITSFDLSINANTIELSNFVPNNPADTAMIIRTTPPTTRLTDSQRTAWRITKTIVSGPFDTINLTNDWSATHGVTWSEITPEICGNLSFMIQSVNKSSGIASTGLIKIAEIMAFLKFTVLFSDFQPDATKTKDLVIGQLPAATIMELDKIKHSISFSGGALNQAFISIKYDTPTLISGSSLDVFQAPGDNEGSFFQNQTGNSNMPGQTVATDIIARIFVDNAGLTGKIDDLTQGSADIWIVLTPTLL